MIKTNQTSTTKLPQKEFQNFKEEKDEKEYMTETREYLRKKRNSGEIKKNDKKMMSNQSLLIKQKSDNVNYEKPIRGK